MAIPRHILRFEALLYLSLAIDALSFPFRDSSFAGVQDDTLPAVKLTTAAFIAFCVFLVWLAARRRQNWARWVMVVLTTLSAMSLVQMIGAGSFDGGTAIDVLTTALAVAGVYFSFTGDAKNWLASS